MKYRSVVPLAALAAAAAGAYLFVRGHGLVASRYLVDEFPSAVKRSTLPEVETFSVYELAVDGETKRAVYARPPSRMTWTVQLPSTGQLRLWLALRPEAWGRPGDGVVFRVGVSDGRAYTEVLSRRVNPHADAGDRRWVPVSIDLSAFGGQSVDLIFNTDVSPPGQPPNATGDLALWGDPEIVSGR